MSLGLPRLRLRFDPPKPGRTTVLPLAAAPPATPAAEAAGFAGQSGQAVRLSLPGFPDLVLAGAGAGQPLDWERAGGEAMALLLAEAMTPAAEPSPINLLRARPAVSRPLRRIALDLRALPAAAAMAVATGAALRAWQPPVHRREAPPKPPRLILHVAEEEAMAPAFIRMLAILRGVALARDLVTEPANLLTPKHFAARLRRLRRFGVGVEVFGRSALQAAGAGAILAVGRAAANPPRLVVLRWGDTTADPVVFIGKGMTFDTGGISIKPALHMEEMRADMAGAAAAAGAILTLALRNSPAAAVAVLALAENMPGADAWRPGDIIRTLSGRSVETIDTDAEGRMILADALAWAVREFTPAALVDLATLTGSIVTALGHHRAGLFGNDPPLLAMIAAAGELVGDSVWPMPIAAEHEEALKSDIADLRQCSSGSLQPDACHAAAFLRHFAEGIPWAHLDIAGVETREEASWQGPAGATGFGVRLLDALTAARFEAPDQTT